MDIQCKNCGQSFTVTDKDKKYYQRIKVPLPTLCPECRFQRRLAVRCERSLYKRKCSLCDKNIISIYNEENPFPVYCRECFWSDQWNPLEYGKEFNFNQPFFEQFKELQDKVPRMMIFTNKSQNCDYTCHSFQNKNCYLCFGIKDCEELYYCSKGVSCRNCLDCLQITQCELCYECIDGFNLYNCKFLANCTNCTDCFFSWDLAGCQNCFGCSGLRRKNYHIFNKSKTKVEYFAEMKKINLSDKNQLKLLAEKFEEIKLKTPHKYLNVLNNENCTGDYLRDSKNCIECFDSDNLEDCAYCVFIFRDKDSYDLYAIGDSELAYDCMGVEEVYNLKFSYTTDNTKDSSYCSLCFGSNNLFGCIGLRHKEYCILNKQYKKEEYESLLPKILKYMTETGEWGEFFPIKYSPYAYNEAVVNEYFPLSKDEIIKKGWRFKEKDPKEYIKQIYTIPENVKDISEAILEEILACTVCKKNYKIIPKELSFYKKHNLSIPKICPDCRHKIRLSKRNPRKFWERPCQKCGITIKTTYSPDRPEIVYCEKCYLQAII